MIFLRSEDGAAKWALRPLLRELETPSSCQFKRRQHLHLWNRASGGACSYNQQQAPYEPK